MGSSTKLISFLFLFTLFSSMQIHGREFFSKIPSVNNNEKETTTIPKTEQEQTTQKTFVKEEEEQEPRFVPETQNGYGLYGHESGQLPPSTTTTTAAKETYEPYVTPVKYHPDEPYNSIPESAAATTNNYNNNKNRNTFYYNKNAYENTEQKNLGEARFTERGWNREENRGNNHYYNNNNNNGGAGEQQNLGEASFTERGWSNKENQNSYNNGGERMGMSDTRFLENGKYYYDVNNEKNYYPNQFENSKEVASFNENRYNNNNNNNNMGSRYYQNQQEEFEENEEEEFEP